MFDTRKFGHYLAELRKAADMTQFELGERLGVTRQAVSRYEHGDSFPDVSILMIIADVFTVSLDELISSGGATEGETRLLGSIARGKNDVEGSLSDIIGIAPMLKPGVLGEFTARLALHGIDISSLCVLAEYLSDTSVVCLLDRVSEDEIDVELLGRLLPFLDTESKYSIFEKILSGEISWKFIKSFLPHGEWLISQLEAAVLDGAIPDEALAYICDYVSSRA